MYTRDHNLTTVARFRTPEMKIRRQYHALEHPQEARKKLMPQGRGAPHRHAPPPTASKWKHSVQARGRFRGPVATQGAWNPGFQEGEGDVIGSRDVEICQRWKRTKLFDHGTNVGPRKFVEVKTRNDYEHENCWTQTCRCGNGHVW